MKSRHGHSNGAVLLMLYAGWLVSARIEPATPVVRFGRDASYRSRDRSQELFRAKLPVFQRDDHRLRLARD